jgi:hypothetical protein
MRKLTVIVMALVCIGSARAEYLGVFNNSMAAGVVADTVKGVGNDTIVFNTPNTANFWSFSIWVDSVFTGEAANVFDDSLIVWGRDIPSASHFRDAVGTPFRPILWDTGTSTAYSTTEYIIGAYGMKLFTSSPNPPDSNYAPGATEACELILQTTTGDTIRYIIEIQTKNND